MKTEFGLIGKNISYSFSVSYFTNKFKIEKLNDLTYQNFDIQNINDFSNILKNNPNIKGLNVTIPYKESVIPFLDKINKNAQKIGAVNCIKITKKSKLKGYNTDWLGFYNTLKNEIYAHKKALIFGNGGASKAIQFALKKLKIKFLVVSRNPTKKQINYTDISEKLLINYTILINTTPIGTFPNVSDCISIPYNLISNKHLAYDLIYNPEKTQFLKNCEDNGATIINGYKMLVEQAEESFKIWMR
jgi:shikimate dehydrogenase